MERRWEDPSLADVSPFRQTVSRRAIVRADAIFLASGLALSARRRCAAHSVTIRGKPRNPLVLSCYQSSAPFRHPAVEKFHVWPGQPSVFEPEQAQVVAGEEPGRAVIQWRGREDSPGASVPTGEGHCLKAGLEIVVQLGESRPYSFASVRLLTTIIAVLSRRRKATGEIDERRLQARNSKFLQVATQHFLPLLMDRIRPLQQNRARLTAIAGDDGVPTLVPAPQRVSGGGEPSASYGAGRWKPLWEPGASQS